MPPLYTPERYENTRIQNDNVYFLNENRRTMSRFSAACIVMIVVTMSIVGCLDVDSSDEDGDGVEDSIDEYTGLVIMM